MHHTRVTKGHLLLESPWRTPKNAFQSREIKSSIGVDGGKNHLPHGGLPSIVRQLEHVETSRCGRKPLHIFAANHSQYRSLTWYLSEGTSVSRELRHLAGEPSKPLLQTESHANYHSRVTQSHSATM